MKPPFVIFWLPGRDAQQNFFSHQFTFSIPVKGIRSILNHHTNHLVRPKKKLAYGNPLTLAQEWKKGLEEGRYASRAAIAREHGISRARVTQLMNLLKISPAILKITDGLLTERRVRGILKGA